MAGWSSPVKTAKNIENGSHNLQSALFWQFSCICTQVNECTAWKLFHVNMWSNSLQVHCVQPTPAHYFSQSNHDLTPAVCLAEYIKSVLGWRCLKSTGNVQLSKIQHPHSQSSFKFVISGRLRQVLISGRVSKKCAPWYSLARSGVKSTWQHSTFKPAPAFVLPVCTAT